MTFSGLEKNNLKFSRTFEKLLFWEHLWHFLSFLGSNGNFSKKTWLHHLKCVMTFYIYTKNYKNGWTVQKKWGNGVLSRKLANSKTTVSQQQRMPQFCTKVILGTFLYQIWFKLEFFHKSDYTALNMLWHSILMQRITINGWMVQKI